MNGEKYKILAIDTETEMMEPKGTKKVNIRHNIPHLVCTTWSDSEEAGLIGWRDEGALLELLDTPNVLFAFHNAAFDLGVLGNMYVSVRAKLEELVHDNRIIDTRVMYLLRNPDPIDKAITLQFLCRAFLNEDLPKTDVRTSFTRDGSLNEEQVNYAIKDAIVTRQIAEALRGLPKGCIRNHWGAPPPNVTVMASLTCDLPDADLLYSKAAALRAWYLEPQGMSIDRVRLRCIHDEFEMKFDGLQEGLLNAGLANMKRMPLRQVTVLGKLEGDYERSWMMHTARPPRLRRLWKGQVEEVEGKVTKSTVALMAAFEKFAKELDITPPTSGKLKRTSLKRDDWKDYMGVLPAPLKMFMEFQKVSKYLSAFLKPLLDAGATAAHSDYYVPGAATGRWACRKPNLQQVPKAHGIRNIYVARLGKTFVMADYPTLELYTLAHSMECLGISGNLMESLRSGEDIHTRTASLMYNKPLVEIEPEERQSAKAANFGLPGGMGVNRFWLQAKSMGLQWTKAHAYDIRNRWFNAYADIKAFMSLFNVNPYKQLCPPGMDTREWLERLGFDPEETWPTAFDLTRKINKGAIYTVGLPSGRVIPDRKYSAAANCLFQGPGADVITQAFANVCKRDLNPVAVVHDSITLECDENQAIGFGDELAMCMQEALILACPSVPTPPIDVEFSNVWK